MDDKVYRSEKHTIPENRLYEVKKEKKNHKNQGDDLQKLNHFLLLFFFGGKMDVL